MCVFRICFIYSNIGLQILTAIKLIEPLALVFNTAFTLNKLAHMLTHSTSVTTRGITHADSNMNEVDMSEL